jgi:hypothetical protein
LSGVGLRVGAALTNKAAKRPKKTDVRRAMTVGLRAKRPRRLKDPHRGLYGHRQVVLIKVRAEHNGGEPCVPQSQMI